MLNIAEIARDPRKELTKVFEVLDKASVSRAKGVIICMKPNLGAVDRENYIVPVWMIYKRRDSI